jgi:hypothetical protein
MGNDIDYVLLEMELAVELVLCGRMTSIYPILLGTEEFREKPYRFVGRLPEGVPRATKERLLAILAEFGVTPSAGCETRSVRETVSFLLEYHGVRWDRMDFAEMEARLAGILADAVSRHVVPAPSARSPSAQPLHAPAPARPEVVPAAPSTSGLSARDEAAATRTSRSTLL